jgi:glycosyltransferase involved in cell wall biosynthesis
MRILVAHNRYRSALPSGENVVVDQDIELLRTAGVDVVTYTPSSDEIESHSTVAKLALSSRPVFSRRTRRDIATLIERTRPDVIHLHNPYPFVSPSFVPVAAKRSVPVVQSLHNYRFVCAQGEHFRDGGVCTVCAGKRVPWPAVQHGCYRDSRPQSLAMAAALTVHRSTWLGIDRLLPVSDFVAARLVEWGADPAKVVVHPNAVPDPGPPAPLDSGFLFAGRLDEQKGVGLLLDAWSRARLDGCTRLVIAGDGPLRARVEAAARTTASIEYRGRVDRTEMATLIDGCAAVIVPSLWFEAMPMMVLEAFSRGRAVLAANVGATASLVDERVGARFEPDADALATLLRSIDRASLDRWGRAARREYLKRYTPDRRVERAMSIYEDVAHVEV